MPRKPRIDAPGLLCHVMARGIERRQIFADDQDRDFFLSRLGDLLGQTGTAIYAFALLPNHFHLLLRRLDTPIATVMRRLLTGYAIHFNKRQSREGHLFQNRYKSIICQDDPYFRELVRYIHLNPIRAGIVESTAVLGGYPYAGHSYMMGKRQCHWFDGDSVLGHFGHSERQARRSYLDFVTQGIPLGRRPELVGGGLKRSLGYPERYPQRRQAFDDRILGEGGFVEDILATGGNMTVQRPVERDYSEVLSDICLKHEVTRAQVLGTSRNRKVTKARADLARLMIDEAGLSGAIVAQVLSTSSSAVSKMVSKGRAAAAHPSNTDQ